ncbi:protein PNS1 isoform X2 [Beta vulgaris subsp. vulgaris]|uniref:protein PNS1 isoform X2 n=1 Tax=Beta vulgaris subsp. vulgaris TaxID=3555 RepID=UPI0020371936|nr:protein PNS1 isoform X2 [Beta vulgaris subsp. vulgaris]
MGALESETGEEREKNREEQRRRTEEEETEDLEDNKDLEKGEKIFDTKNPHKNYHASMLRTLNPTNPLRIVINGNTRVPLTTPPPPPQHHAHYPPPAPHHVSSHPPPRPSSQPPPPLSQPRYIPTIKPTPQPTITSLNSRGYTNKISLILFVLQTIAAIGLVGFLIYKAIEGFIQDGKYRRKAKSILKFYLPQVEAASFLSIVLAFCWQKSVRVWPRFMFHFILWSSFFMSLAAGILLICFQKPSTDACGAALVAFAIGNGLYSCWVTQRTRFCTKILIKSLEPVSKFPDLNHPTYYMLIAGFLWMSLWILAVIGALHFYFPPLVIIALVLSLAWTTEVMRNVANLTVSRVIALYYLRGMQSSTYFCFQRALTRNLGSACLGSLFVPTIEALRIISRGLNLVEGEDEFMFSCAHCCLNIMNSIFRYGNGWAYVQIAAYGKNFTKASIDTWAIFEKQEMEEIVDSDITSAVCFLTGVCSGSICVIMVAAWTNHVHQGYTATLSLLAFYVGYLMTRIAMALPHACVSCYFVCYAENPENRLFDKTISDRLNLIKSGRDVAAPTPRVPHRFNRSVRS